MTLPVKYDGRSREYQAWKSRRLQRADSLSNEAVPTISFNDITDLDAHSKALSQLCKNVRDYGYALYQCNETQANTANRIEQLHRQLSLTENDTGVVSDKGSLSLLTDLSGTPRGKFIPYTSKAMGWHTDGYYNDAANTLRCFALHCVSQAATGGALSLMDDELLFIAVQEDDPDLISLLSQPDAMTLPANKDDLGHDRPDRQAPVFFCHTDGTLGTRFTTRTKNIRWKNHDTGSAAERVTEIVAASARYQHTVRLQSGQGVVTRNILHRREAFVDDAAAAPRQMLRGRYMQLPSVLK